MSLKVLWSHPMTAPDGIALPPDFTLIWRERTVSSEFSKKYPALGSRSELVLRLYVAWTLFRQRKNFDVIATGRYGEFFALLQGLWPFGRRPLLLLDVEWYAAHGSGWRDRLSRFLHHRIAIGASRIQVFCRVEAGNYARRFGIPEERFVWIPYCMADDYIPGCHVADNSARPVLFTGGLHHRDYATLFRAIDGLPLELRVAAPLKDLENMTVPRNVRLLGTIPGSEYWRELRECHMVVLSLEPGLARCPGVITYVGAMARGKCVLVNEPAGAPDYIDHGKTGFIIAASDPAALRTHLTALLSDPERMRMAGENALIGMRERFSPAAYFSAVHSVISGIGAEATRARDRNPARARSF